MKPNKFLAILAGLLLFAGQQALAHQPALPTGQGTVFSPSFLGEQQETGLSFLPETGLFNPYSTGALIAAGTGFTLNAINLVCELSRLKSRTHTFSGTPFDREQVNPVDRLFMRSYSHSIDTLGTVAVVAALAAPAAVLMPTAPSGDWLSLGILYLETVLLANGIKEMGKLLVYRARPYMYYQDYPQEEVDSGDWCSSWPSGHTTLAFTSAAFLTYVFSKYHGDSGWSWLVGGLSYGLAATVAIMRMASGNHFLTDALTGAAIGTACGILAPWLSTLGPKNSPVKATPLGVSLTIRL